MAQQQQTIPPIDFGRASIHKQTALETKAFTAGGTVTDQLISTGYLARLIFPGSFNITNTTGTTPAADNPWDIIARLSLKDSSGSNIYSLTGYNSYLHSKYLMAHRGWVDGSTDTTVYVGTTFANGVTPLLQWEIPLWTNERDLIGLVPNQSDAYKYTYSIDWSPLATLMTNVGDFALTGSVTPYYEYFTVPSPSGLGGQPQQQTPPYFGVVHQVTDTVWNGGVAPGNNQKITIPTGKVYRGFVLVVRDAGVRKNAIAAIRLKYGDDTTLWSASGTQLRQEMFERNGIDSPTGVYIIDRMSDSALRVGADYRRQYIDTRQLAQFWFEVDFIGIAGAGTVNIVSDALIVPNGMTI